MVPPPFLVGGTILFWGWATGFLWVALLMAVIVELPRFFRLRWEFSEDDFERLWTLCCIIYLGVLAVRSFVGGEAVSAAREPAGGSNILSEPSTVWLAMTRWIPLVFFPVMAAQAYSSRPSIRVTVLFWMFRKRMEKSWFQPSMHLGYPYLAGCVLAASAANVRTAWFFAGLAVIIASALWTLRPRRFTATLWTGVMVAAMASGYWAHEGMLVLHAFIESKSNELLARFMNRDVNPVESHTSIGRIGRVKLSGEIVLRVEPLGKVPTLLREAVYNRYSGSVWSAGRSDFNYLAPEADVETWKFQKPQLGTEAVYITQFFPSKRGLLAVPTGVSELSSLPVGSVATNQLGAIRVKEAPGLARFRAHYSDRATFEASPVPSDLAGPEGAERAALHKVLTSLRLEVGTDEAEAVRRLEKFFASEFHYTTWLKIPAYNSKNDESPLARFLLKERAGHCEYFATATVLLLRELAIPARYATGFAVDEVAKDGKTFIVRQRHAHAWVLVWNGERWRNVDTTPGSWISEEERLKSSWESWADWFAAVKYAFAKFRWLKEERTWQNILPYILVPMLLLLGWRVSRGLGRSRRRHLAAEAAKRHWPGEDSEYFALEAALAAHGLDRAEHETIVAWRERVRAALDDEAGKSLVELRRLHLRLRFDPAGLTPDDRSRLRDGSRRLAQAVRANLTDKPTLPARGS